MIQVFTPMKDGSIAVQTVENSGPQSFRKGDRLERSASARQTLVDMGLERLAARRGTYTGKARGKYAGSILVRLDGNRTAEPFRAELWQPAKD